MKRLKSEKGHSLLELTVGIGISAMIAYAIFAAMRVGTEQADTNQIKMSLQESVREGLYKMIQEIQQSAPAWISIGTNCNSIQFRIPDSSNPTNPDYTINWVNAPLIQYALGGLNNRQILRTNFSTGGISVIANDITSVTFTTAAAAPYSCQQTNPRVVTARVSAQRTLTNGRAVPNAPLQMMSQTEIRNH